MKYLILRSDGHNLINKFADGIKIRPERLIDVDYALFVDKDEVIEVYKISNKIKYDRATGRIDLDCLTLVNNHDLLNSTYVINTFNPATIATI